jgi:DNA-binding PadR family transcriptional regulator
MGMLSTKHVVLGLVIERPGYGYDLQKRLDGRFGFLALSERGIYSILDRLEQDGLIEPLGAKQVGKTKRGSPRLIYRPTPDGAEEFSRWIAEPCELGVAREEVHVKLVLSQPPDWPRVIELTEKLELACLAAVLELQQREGPSLEQLANPEVPWDIVASALIDDAESTRLQGMIDWLQRVRVVVRRRIEPPPRRGRTQA